MGQAQVKENALSAHTQEIFMTFANLLAGKNEGTASGLAFFPGEGPKDPADGLRLWEQAVKIKNFPVNREANLASDPEIVTSFTQALLDDLDERGTRQKGTTFIEIGPGLWESVRMKTAPYIDELQSTDRPVSQYISIDPSKDCATAAANGIKNDYSGIKTRSIVGPFEDARNITTNGTPVAILWGPTIWNSGISSEMKDPELVLAAQLKSIKQVVKSGGYILSTYYSSETRDMDEKAYNDNRNLRLVQSLAHRFEKELTDTNFKADSFEPFVEYRGNGIGRFCMGIKSRRNQTVNLNGSVEQGFKKGEGMVLTNSWRLKEQKLYDIVNAAGADMIEHKHSKEIGAGMFLARFR